MYPTPSLPDIRLPHQTQTALATSRAIGEALEKFYRHPTSTNQKAAMSAIQAHLAEINCG